MEDENQSGKRKNASHLRLVPKDPPVSFIPQERNVSVFSLIQQEMTTEEKIRSEAAALIALFQTSPGLAAEKLRKLQEAQDPVAQEVLYGGPFPYRR
jgi:hypothetical protein